MPLLAFILAVAAAVILAVVAVRAYVSTKIVPWELIAWFLFVAAWIVLHVHPDTNPYVIK